jgi:hypothetical protein
VRLRAEPRRCHTARARTAFAAWQAAAPHLGQPAFAEVELELAPAPAALPSPAVTAIVAALAEGPATLSALRNRVGRAGRSHLSTAEVAQAVEAGLVAFDHATQTYLRRAS